MADLIEKRYGTRPSLNKSGGGAYEIRVGNELIFSKLRSGRYPEDDEIYTMLDARIGK